MGTWEMGCGQPVKQVSIYKHDLLVSCDFNRLNSVDPLYRQMSECKGPV
ncbi:hypothetical protein TRIP_B250156 [uncultured Desulfatiglans sp.]|nr:hypothetical protein TRIP_B250156 [uncultured Desulfatiglans sp.]